MNIERRIGLLTKLRAYITSDEQDWLAVRRKAESENGWFIPGFVDYQLAHIASEFLDEDHLRKWTADLRETGNPRPVGVVMAGNIPLAGFHDFLAVFISGHRMIAKPSAKDFALIDGILKKLVEWEPSLKNSLQTAQQLKGCDAYIATGSNNSSRYFDYYFSKYPHIIRRNRTSVAVLTGNETLEDLALLADDVYLYFGLGCRNVTKLYVPRDYDFLPLLESFKKYNWLADHHKYKNNYDYQLAIMIINKIYYMTNGSILLQQNSQVFSPISQLNYEFYDSADTVWQALHGNQDIQCIVGKNAVAFGEAQHPALNDYADKIDTLSFLSAL